MNSQPYPHQAVWSEPRDYQDPQCPEPLPQVSNDDARAADHAEDLRKERRQEREKR